MAIKTITTATHTHASATATATPAALPDFTDFTDFTDITDMAPNRHGAARAPTRRQGSQT